jgi:hypothetical protein
MGTHSLLAEGYGSIALSMMDSVMDCGGAGPLVIKPGIDGIFTGFLDNRLESSCRIADRGSFRRQVIGGIILAAVIRAGPGAGSFESLIQLIYDDRAIRV